MLTKAQRKKVYERVVGRFRRLAKKLGKNWKEVEINGKSFQDAYAEELAKEEDLIKKGQESKLRRTNLDKIKGFKPKSKRKSALDWLTNPSDTPESHKETCQCPRCVGAFGSEDLVGSIPESDERRAERKEFEGEVNRQLEEACTSGICPRCRSSVCHCEED